MKLPQDQRK